MPLRIRISITLIICGSCFGAAHAQTDCNLDTACVNQILCSKTNGWRFNNTHVQNMNNRTFWYFVFGPDHTLTVYRTEKSRSSRERVLRTSYRIRPYNRDGQLGVEIARFNSDIALLLYHLVPRERLGNTFFQFAYNRVRQKLFLDYHRSGPDSTINEFQ
jgi:hypothetical protein